MKITEKSWELIKEQFQHSFKSSLHYSIATIKKDGLPHITPIGSLILNDFAQGFFFEEYTSRLGKNLEHNDRICIMAVNTDKWRFIKALIKGRLDYPISIRLSGKAGEKREANQNEIKLFHDRIKAFKWTKGYKLLWKDLKFVRDVYFDSMEPVIIKKMLPIKRKFKKK